MFPIMSGIALGLFLLVVDYLRGRQSNWLLIVPLASISIIPVAVWFWVWGGAVRWIGVRPIIAVAVVGGLVLAVLAAFAVSITGWFFVLTILLVTGPTLSVLGVAVLTLGCWTAPPDDSPGVVVCPECLYDLHMQQVCRCPECGTEFTIEELIAADERPLPIGLHAR